LRSLATVELEVQIAGRRGMFAQRKPDDQVF
jgi:hypothetical protein